MATTKVRWVQDRQFVGMDSNRHAVVISGDKDQSGVKPSQLLLISLSACSAYDVVEILQKKRKVLHSLEVTAEGTHDDDPPWAIRKIHLHFRLSGEGLTENAVEQAIRLSEEKYCSVAATVRGVAAITTEFEIVAEPD
ncbi:MAG TPA: OsmC family protein [Desulfobacterales bacterium]